MREEVKAENLSFTEIAKLVGERWQKLDLGEKEGFEAHVAALKERYNAQLSEYKKTEEFREYNKYLAEFKAKYENPADGKRPKLESNTQSSQSDHSDGGYHDGPYMSAQHHLRRDSASSLRMETSSYPHSLASAIVPSPGMLSLEPALHRTHWDGRQSAQFRGQSSLSDDSSSNRTEGDTASRTALLALNTPPAGSPSPSTLGSRTLRSDHGHPQHSQAWSSWQAGQAHSPPSSTHPGSSALISELSASELASNQWRERGVNSIEARSYYNTPAREILPPLTMPNANQDSGFSAAYRTLPPPLRASTGNQNATLPHNLGPSTTSPNSTDSPSNDALPLRHGVARLDSEVTDTLSSLAEQRPSYHHRRTPQDQSKHL